MEKRALLAFILMLLVLFFFQTYFSPRPRRDQEGTEKARVPKKVEEKKVVAEVLHSKAKAKEFVIENRVFRVTFTEQGGGIKSVKLKEYRESIKDSREKEILEDIGPYPSIPSISIRIDEKRFVEDVCTAKLTGYSAIEKPQEITFSCKSPDGTVFEKKYTIFPSDYALDFRLELGEKAKGEIEIDIPGISRKKVSYGFKGPVVYTGRSLEQLEKVEKRMDFKKGYTYFGFDEGYFALIWIPKDKLHPLTILKGEANIPVMRLSVEGDSVTARIFFGPKRTDVLKSLNVKAEKIIDFGWFDVIAKPLVMLLNFTHRFTGNYGVDIILLTILIKLIFHPLTLKSFKSMKEMQRLQPQIAKLREKYKDDREKLNRELMELYRRRGINPLSGCLPMLIQIPVFIALYKALTGAIELRHAPFIFWIKDLSEPEDLFSFTVLGFSVPVRVLPLVMGVTQVIQQKLTPTSGDPFQEKFLLFMPIFFTFLFYGFPSGLVLYWLVNNVISIFQQLLINKKLS